MSYTCITENITEARHMHMHIFLLAKYDKRTQAVTEGINQLTFQRHDNK